MSSDPLTWSPQAHRAAKISASASAGWESDRRAQEKGPILHDHKIIVPSTDYNPGIAAFFASQGFQFDSEWRQWWRDTRWPHRGRHYSPEAWLLAAKRKFEEIWSKTTKKGATND